MRILVTGAAGFIGAAVSSRLLESGDTVVGFDNLNDYYDVGLKQDRLARLQSHPEFEFVKGDLADATTTESLFTNGDFQRVVHLAAQAGVRYSLENPRAYIDSNIVGFLNILEGCRHHPVEHLLYASSSSVYGDSTRTPFSTHHNVDHPVSLYAATKKSDELMAHTYSHLYEIPTTGLRFFTVYGPWGRPDMSYFIFTRKILAGEAIPVFNYGRCKRDFTYVDDIVEGVVHALDQPPSGNPDWTPEEPDPASSRAPYRIFNIGNNRPVELTDFIAVLEQCLGQKAEMKLLPPQPGDVTETYADIDDLVGSVGYRPRTGIEDGLKQFVAWYLEYYGGK